MCSTASSQCSLRDESGPCAASWPGPALPSDGMRRIAPFILLLAAVAVLVAQRRDHPRARTFGLAQVLRVVDGDTIRVRLDGRTERVRYGYARTLTIAPNVAHANQFAQLARTARQSGRGLWSACAIG